jgi:hypothetical protein
MPQLFAVDCSGCGQPTVTSELCERPDLCYPCFAAPLLAAKDGDN